MTFLIQYIFNSNSLQILQETNLDVQTANINGTFIIDNTLGRDVKFTSDKLGSGAINQIQLQYPNGTTYLIGEGVTDTFSKTFDFLEVNMVDQRTNYKSIQYISKFQPGYYKYTILSVNLNYLLVTVSSKAADNVTLPYRTKCWASTDGFEEIDAQVTKLAVFAQVEQGNRPVLHAKVE